MSVSKHFNVKYVNTPLGWEVWLDTQDAEILLALNDSKVLARNKSKVVAEIKAIAKLKKIIEKIEQKQEQER